MISDVFDYLSRIKHDSAYVVIYMSITAMVIVYISVKCSDNLKAYKGPADLPSECMDMEIEGYVTQVPDGDGFDFIHVPKFNFGRIPAHRNSEYCFKARLAGIDAPEMSKDPAKRQPLAAESKLFLEFLILHKVVNIRIIALDPYKRVLVIVHTEGINVNNEMLKTGLAVLYKEANAVYGSCYNLFANSENLAKGRQNYIWGYPNYEMPCDFKKRMISEAKQNSVSLK
jgi:endonuclease YncB( thermonuclease family)